MPMASAAAHASKIVGKVRGVFMMSLSTGGSFNPCESTIRCRGIKTIGQNA
jgi:hypothetical protein